MALKRIPLYSPVGIDTNPAQTGLWKAPYGMRNLDLDFEVGQLRLRDGFTISTDTVEGGIQDKLLITSFAGSTSELPYHKLYSIHNTESAAHTHHRLFIAGVGTANRWLDAETGTSYSWGELTNPDQAPTISYPANQTYFGDTAGTSVYVFRICWTYANDRYGMETPPSKAYPFNVRLNETETETLRFTFNHFSAPAWADQVKYYITRVPEKGFISRLLSVGGETRGPQEDQSLLRRGPDGSVIRLPGLDGSPNIETDAAQADGFEFVLVHSRRRSNLSTAFSNAQAESMSIGFIQETVGTDTSVYVSSGNYSETLPILWAEPPPSNFEFITLYAGRMWGYDRDTNTIRFSFIDGNGVSRYDWFPSDEVAIPHSISLVGMEESSVQAIKVKPGRGGLYVFFKDRIATITGQALISGLYSTQLPPRTDLDASGGVPEIGTSSPNGVVNFRSVVIFLGSDRRLYQIDANDTVSNIGHPIQHYLDLIPIDNLDTIFAFGYNDKYHLIVDNSRRTLVFDIENKYWTSYDWGIKSALWDRKDDKLYGITRANGLIELYNGDTDAPNDVTPTWEWESQTITLPDISTITGVYINVRPPYKEINLSVLVDGAGVFGGSFTPSYPNRFLQGVYGRGTEVKVIISGTGEPPNIQNIQVEYSS